MFGLLRHVAAHGRLQLQPLPKPDFVATILRDLRARLRVRLLMSFSLAAASTLSAGMGPSAKYSRRKSSASRNALPLRSAATAIAWSAVVVTGSLSQAIRQAQIPAAVGRCSKRYPRPGAL